MRSALRSALLIMMLISAGALHAQNPFTQREPDRQPRVYGTGVPRVIREWSRELQTGIADLSRRVRGGDWTAGISAFLLAVVFGAVHIAGPGHGKVFALSYFSARRARPRDGLLYSAVVNAVDSLAAFGLVILGYVLLRAVVPNFRAEGSRYLQLIAYGLIVVFGVLHLLSHVRGHHHDGGHEDGARDERSRGDAPDSPEASHAEIPAASRIQAPPWLLALSVGLIPCPVSTILLVYGVANGVLPFMVLMVIGVSVGGFLTMSGIALAIIAGRRRVLVKLDGAAAAKAAAVLEYAASAVIIVVGAALFASLV